MGFNELSAVLWRQRELLTLLLFKLEEEQLLLASGRTRWLAHATREVEMVLAEISRLELERAAESEGVAISLGLTPDVGLGAIADAAPAPWDDLLGQHRRGLLEATQEISAVAEANRDILHRGYRAVTDTLRGVMGSEQQGYDAGGRPTTAPGRHQVLDGVV